MKKLIVFFSLISGASAWAQPYVNNCDGAVPGCSTPSFEITSSTTGNIVDFTAGSISNPSTNPNGGNAGCLLSGETSSTFITISIVSNGTLAWSIEGNGGGCFDWIMWPYQSESVTCAAIHNDMLPPVSCNWNGNCNGFTGMAPSNNIPSGGYAVNFEDPLNVTAGQTFLLCLSNYSFTNQNVDLNFFGTAQVVCGVSAADQTICLGNSANVTIATPGLINPTFNWLVTTGVSDPTDGTNVTVTPTVTTTYQVEVTQAATVNSSFFIDTATFTITVETPPAPYAGVDDTLCFGQPIHLTGTEGTASNLSSWSSVVPPGMSPPAAASFSPNFNSLTPTVTVNQPGLYKFVFREQNPTCGTVRDTVHILVTQHQHTTTGINPMCGGSSDGQIIINSVDAVEYSFDNGTTWGTNNTSWGYPVGVYNVCSRNAMGCQKCSAVTLAAPPPVTLTVSNDTLICQNGTATLIASAGYGSGFSYQWDHTSSTAAIQTVSPVTNSYYHVTAVNQNGCVSPPDSIYVSVRSGITGDITPGFTICPGYPQSVTTHADGGIGSPYTFTWSSGEVQNGMFSMITANPSATQTYTVTINDVCESTPLVLTTEVTVAPLPEPQFAATDPKICEPAVFELTNTTDTSMTASYYWMLSDGQTYANQPVIHTEEMYAGMYDVQLVVVSPQGCIDSVTYSNYLISDPKPVADFRYSPSPIKMLNTEVSFSNQSFNGSTYEWIFEEGSPGTSILENPVTTFPDGEVGNYQVMLITTSEEGCKDTTTQILPVLPEVLIYAPNSFTPDGDEFNQTWSVVMQGIDVYDFNMTVFDRWGQIVWETNDIEVGWDGTYQGRILPSGTYVWTIRVKDALSDEIYEYNGHVNILK